MSAVLMLTPLIKEISLFLLRVMALSLLSMVMVSGGASTSVMVILSYSVSALTSVGTSEICQMPSTVARF